MSSVRPRRVPVARPVLFLAWKSDRSEVGVRIESFSVPSFVSSALRFRYAARVSSSRSSRASDEALIFAVKDRGRLTARTGGDKAARLPRASPSGVGSFEPSKRFICSELLPVSKLRLTGFMVWCRIAEVNI